MIKVLGKYILKLYLKFKEKIFKITFLLIQPRWTHV